MTGFGHTGPKGSDRAYDVVIQAYSGIMAANGEANAPPVPHGNTHPACAGYATYETKDGLRMIGAWSNRQMGALYRLLGDEDRASRIEATARSDIGSLQSDDAAFLGVVLRDKAADDWERLLNAAGAPTARVRRLDETVTEAQLASRGVLQTYPGSDAPGVPKSLPVAGFTYAHGGPAFGGRLPRRRQLSETVLQQSGNVPLGIGEFVLARFDLGDVENIVDQVEE